MCATARILRASHVHQDKTFLDRFHTVFNIFGLYIYIPGHAMQSIHNKDYEDAEGMWEFSNKEPFTHWLPWQQSRRRPFLNCEANTWLPGTAFRWARPKDGIVQHFHLACTMPPYFLQPHQVNFGLMQHLNKNSGCTGGKQRSNIPWASSESFPQLNWLCWGVCRSRLITAGQRTGTRLRAPC